LGLQKTHLSVDKDSEESSRFFSKPFGQRWGVRKSDGVGRPHWYHGKELKSDL